MPIESIIARKSLGVLMHPTCIPGGRVCGTFGRGAKEWIKKLHKHGIEYWQFLPLTPTDSTGSPYSSPSSFALNPWFLDIDDLIEKGFIFISNKELGLKIMQHLLLSERNLICCLGGNGLKNLK